MVRECMVAHDVDSLVLIDRPMCKEQYEDILMNIKLL